MPRKTTRLYYGQNPVTGDGLYWTMKVRNATKSVVLNGTVEEAMKGKPGLSIGCHLAQTAYANRSAFDHSAIYISFTKSVALVVTKISKGTPIECVRYRHNYGKYVDLNDKDPGKTTVKAHPELFNRRFTLGPYKTQPNHWKPEYGRKQTGERSSLKMMRGERARLHHAGLIMQPV